MIPLAYPPSTRRVASCLSVGGRAGGRASGRAGGCAGGCAGGG